MVFLRTLKPKITPQQFRDIFRDIIGSSISDDELIEFGILAIPDFPEENIDLLKKLKPLYKTLHSEQHQCNPLRILY